MMTESWCLLFNDKKELISAPSIAKAIHIYGLKEAIKKEYTKELENVNAHHLVIWQCKQPTLLATEEENKLQEHLLKIDFDNGDQIVKLTSGTKLARLALGEDEVLLVQVPGAINSSF